MLSPRGVACAESCDNSLVRISSREAPLWQRLLLAFAMVVAVVGMHHLTSLGCGEPVAHHAVIEGADSASDSEPSGGTSGVSPVRHGSVPGLVCLALLIAVGVVFRVVGGLLVRKRAPRAVLRSRIVALRVDDPPDLHVLSISRT